MTTSQLPSANFTICTQEKQKDDKSQPVNPLDIITKLKNSTHDQLIEAAMRLTFLKCKNPLQSLKTSSKEHLLVKLSAYLATEEGKTEAFIKWPMKSWNAIYGSLIQDQAPISSLDASLQALKENCVTSLELLGSRQLPTAPQQPTLEQLAKEREERKQRRALRRQQIIELNDDIETSVLTDAEIIDRYSKKLVRQEKRSQYHIREEWNMKLHNINVDDIKKEEAILYPTIGDGKKVSDGQIECICWVSRPLKNRDDFLKCSKCHTLQHKRCIVKNKASKTHILPYKCPNCQMCELDPLKVPVVTLIKPFKIRKILGNNAQKFKLLQFCKKEAMIPEELERYLLLKHEVLFTEVRCIRLDAFDNPIQAQNMNQKQQYPTKGYYSFNYKDGKEFVVTSESEFYRKNQPELPDPLTLEGIGLERIRREDLIFDVSAYIKPGPNFVEIAKFEDSHQYACALYISKIMNIYDMNKYIRLNQVESYLESYERVKNHVASNNYFHREQITVRCPISQSRLKLPARGEKCEHLSCFEAENYLLINTKCKKWLCPICKKPTYNIYVDSFMIQVLKKVNAIYPLDLKLDQLKNKKEVVETLLAELNQHRRVDEQEQVILDSNDIDHVTLFEDLSIQVGVRYYMPNPDPFDTDKHLLDYNPKDYNHLLQADKNILMLNELRKDLVAQSNANQIPEALSGIIPVKVIQPDIVKIPYDQNEALEIVEDELVEIPSEMSVQKQPVESNKKRRKLNPEIALGEVIEIQ